MGGWGIINSSQKDVRGRLRHRALFGCGLVLGLAAVPAASFAQSADPYSSDLFGSWGLVRPVLADHGVNINLDFITQTAGDVSGGMRQGFDYAQQIGFSADIDWSKLAGIPGFSTHMVVISRAGRNVSADYTGDNVIQLQDIYGSFNEAARLAFLFSEEKLAGNAVDITAGRMPIQLDFDSSPLYCDFMTGALCGDPRAISATPGVTPFPVATWAGRMRISPSPQFYVMAGLYEDNPADGGRSGFDWSTDGADGVTVPVEIGYTPSFGPDKLPGHYKIGVIHSTADAPDYYYDENGNPAVLTGLPPRQDHGATAFYVLADQMLQRHGPGDDNGLILLGGYEHTSSDVSLFQNSAFAALLDKGLFPSRPNDTAGMMFTYINVSSQLAAAEKLEAQYDLPYSGGATGVQGNEEILEMNYDIAAYRGISIMPDIQYIIHPGATSTYRNALVVGLKTHIFF